MCGARLPPRLHPRRPPPSPPTVVPALIRHPRLRSGTQVRNAATPTPVLPNTHRHHPPTVVPAKAGTHVRGAATPQTVLPNTHRHHPPTVVPCAGGLGPGSESRMKVDGRYEVAHEPFGSLIVVPAKAGTQGPGRGNTHPSQPRHPEHRPQSPRRGGFQTHLG